jgi:hypothetical protein
MVGYPGSNLTAASGGWTLGPTATVATIGQIVYNLAWTGSTTAQFSGTLGLWALYGSNFVSSASSGMVKRRPGFVN